MRPYQALPILSIETPLGNNAFILTYFTGYETFSQPYHYHLMLLSENKTIQANQLLGKSISFQIILNSTTRIFSGIVSRFIKGAINLHGFRHYQITVVPWYFALELISDCQCFQKKTIPEILLSYCEKIGFNDIDISGLKQTYSPLELCVQFNESAFNFLSRLLQQAEINYYFKQEKTKQTLMLLDTLNILPILENVHISKFTNTRQLGTMRQTSAHYDFLSSSLTNFQSANTQLNFDVESQPEKYERFYYPPDNVHQTLAEITTMNQRREQSAASQWEIFSGESYDPELAVGRRFKELIITSCRIEAHNPHYSVGENKLHYFQCHFAAIKKNAYVSATSYKKTIIPGVQTATVIGAEKQELCVDNYGRIKVRFHWDGVSQDYNKASWIRTSQLSTGDLFGTQFIPRVGQEVLIHYLGGALDHPFVTGTLANENHQAAFILPEHENKSWIKTHTLQSSDINLFNHLILDDSPSQEKFCLHAQKNMTSKVHNNFYYYVNGNDQISIGSNEIKQIKSGLIYTAKSICLHGGGSEIILDDSGIRLNGSANSGGKINLLTKDAGEYKPIARVGDNHRCPKHTGSKAHEGGPILVGSPSIKANHQAIARIGDTAHCEVEQDVIEEGIHTFTIHGKPVSRINHKTNHGGEITTGSANVFVGENNV